MFVSQTVSQVLQQPFFPIEQRALHFRTTTVVVIRHRRFVRCENKGGISLVQCQLKRHVETREEALVILPLSPTHTLTSAQPLCTTFSERWSKTSSKTTTNCLRGSHQKRKVGHAVYTVYRIYLSHSPSLPPDTTQEPDQTTLLQSPCATTGGGTLLVL